MAEDTNFKFGVHVKKITKKSLGEDMHSNERLLVTTVGLDIGSVIKPIRQIWARAGRIFEWAGTCSFACILLLIVFCPVSSKENLQSCWH